ncbi:MAG: DUF692 family protein [Alphaproteobacteria bacterium]|nr:DUF692 family protein [Alphaproteobacteria bacterium]
MSKNFQAYAPNPSGGIPADPMGIGLRGPHYREILEKPPKLGWLEVHPENYFGGGIHRHTLSKIRENFPLSMHAVGLSLGSVQPVSEDHLKHFKELIDIFDPFLVSDHVSWSASGNAHMNDLLPLPYTQETLQRLSENIDQTQTYFGRTMIVENPSTYIAFKDNEMEEVDFMNKLCEKTGCGMLLDINNIYVQSRNHGLDPYDYIDKVDVKHVGEMHLAGHVEKKAGDGVIVVDSHNQPVRDEVWVLFEYAVEKIGVRPTLIEWDQDFPPLSTLIKEAEHARSIIQKVYPKELDHAAE